MSGAHRIASGGLINRAKPLSFTFDGKTYQGFEGDTLASALLANNVQLVARSFKYHRPRGILTAGSEEPNALVELRSGARHEPNVRSTVAELYDGLVAKSQNRWPSLGFDLGAVNSLLSPFFAAGFYYKTFMWPAAFWEKVYEPLIRRAAGLGKPPLHDDVDGYEKAFAHCDVLVIGAGPAGLSAALAAARAGARVILADEGPLLGGRLLSDKRMIGNQSGLDWAGKTEAELASMPNVRLMPRTTIFGAYDHGVYGALERVNDHVATPPAHEPRQRAYRIYAKRAVLAAGAIERPHVFGNNDRPGIMLGSAMRTYINRYAVTPTKRVVVFTSSDEGYATAHDIIAAGGSIQAIIDTRADVTISTPKDVPHFKGAKILSALGNKQVQGVEVELSDGSIRILDCDGVAMSNGWNPAVHLTCHQGGRPIWDDRANAFLPGKLPPGMSVAGSAQGHFGLKETLADGARLGAAAADELGFKAPMLATPDTDPESLAHTPLWRVKSSTGKCFVDFQHDVTDTDIELANREGFRSVEHMKRYTTLGMATDQGKTANISGLAILGEASGRTMAEVGTTIFRPPYTPVSLGALAGHHVHRNFRPTRLTPSHQWAEEQGAVFMETGLWMRAQFFPKKKNESWLEAMNREVEITRSKVGVCDVSTLGKIDFQGKDVGTFLDRVYTGTFSTLAVGKVRYGLMMREDGFVQDDGTTARLSENHWLMTTTTAGAGKVMAHLEFCHQVLWPELDIAFTSVTEQWAQYSIAGPHARDVLKKLVDAQHNISNDAFPYMACGAITICNGIPARLFRISFSGEMAYEIGVPNRYGDALIRAIMKAGEEFGITPYGLEALSTMRIEKGHVAGGELNGQTTPRDLGLIKMVSQKKDCIGKHMSERPAMIEPDRPIFVGLKPKNPNAKITGGAHFLDKGAKPSLANDLGHMMSVAYSPMLKSWIGLGLVKRGRERIGDTIRAVDFVRGTEFEVEICDPVFFDPEGARLRG
ncbi:MAG: sarcosine oxidase subunit alpha family protein [Alphaproteobacteria bacterium]|nr:sarcosine oxidase subunit alpha family protein [Alphaproteobacteria bacterium]